MRQSHRVGMCLIPAPIMLAKLCLPYPSGFFSRYSCHSNRKLTPRLDSSRCTSSQSGSAKRSRLGRGAFSPKKTLVQSLLTQAFRQRQLRPLAWLAPDIPPPCCWKPYRPGRWPGWKTLHFYLKLLVSCALVIAPGASLSPFIWKIGYPDA